MRSLSWSSSLVACRGGRLPGSAILLILCINTVQACFLAYAEKRLVTFGLLDGEAVVLVYTERRKGPHIISLRKAEKHEARYYFEIAKDYFK